MLVYMKNTEKYRNNNSISIPLMPIIASFIIIILIIIISFNIYATNKEENKNENISSDINIENSNNNKITLQATVDDIEEETSEEQNETEESENNTSEQESSNANMEIHTAPNGEKYSVIAALNIPSLGINYPILSSTSDALLKISLNKYWGANPNEVGNMVVLGHNYKDGKFFSKLSNIKDGAIVEITDLKGKTLQYKVYDTGIIDPYDNTCTSQLTNGQTEITLITCYYENGNPHATKRFYAKARVQ